MEYDESIYNLIPKEKYVPPKEKKHKSRHPADMPPSASTFCLKTTSRPGVANMNGDYQKVENTHSNQGNGLTFGGPRGTYKPETTNFRKKGTGTIRIPEGKLHHPIIQNKLHFILVQKYQYDDNYKKPYVPKKDEKPIMGLVSDKNYIVANAVENILAGISNFIF